MIFRKVQYNKSGQIVILCQSCYQTMLENLLLRNDYFEVHHPVDPSFGEIQVLKYWDTEWEPHPGIYKDDNPLEWACKNGCTEPKKQKYKQGKLF